MKVTDYRKRVQHSDSLTDNKEPEKVEKMVALILSSTGSHLASTHHFTVQMLEAVYLKRIALNST
jgi:hypothetical protein